MLSADLIVAHTTEGIAENILWAWFVRVDSKSNPVDGLSRGDASGDWELQDISFPPELLCKLHAFLADGC